MLLGISQGLAWSTTVVMKIDLVGGRRRGLAMGLNEAAGYLAVAAMAMGSGLLADRFGLRPVPFLVGLAIAVAGLGLSLTLVRETREHARLEASSAPAAQETIPQRRLFALVSWRDRALSSASQAGLVNNLNDGLAWGLLPSLYAGAGLGLGEIGLLAAAYPAVWGAAQLFTGAWSDRSGRKPLIVTGMLTQGAALGVIAGGSDFPAWLAATLLLGLGTAMVYPTLLAVIGDVAHPAWRGGAVGVYRLWRDGGFAVGALVSGLAADALGLRPAVWIVAALTAASGLLVLARMPETLHRGAGASPTAGSSAPPPGGERSDDRS